MSARGMLRGLSGSDAGSTAGRDVAGLADDVDAAFRLSTTLLALLLQFGLAFRAVGRVDPLSVQSLLHKAISDFATAALVYWVVGFELETGGGLASVHPDRLSGFLTCTVMAATAVAGYSGSAASRISYSAYVLLLIVVVGVVEPTAAFWVLRKGGWLNEPAATGGLHMIDFGGAAPIHIVAGVAALVASIAAGPRRGRFAGGNAISRFHDAGHLKWNSRVYGALGSLLAWLGAMALAASMAGGIAHGRSAVAGRAIMNTILGPAAGAVAGTALSLAIDKRHDLRASSNGLLAGIAATAAAAGVVDAPWAVAIGALGSVAARGCTHALARCGVDDVVDAFAVHGAAGFVGVVATGLAASSDLVSADAVVLDGRRMTQVGVQLVGACAVAGLAAACTALTLAAVRVAPCVSVRVGDAAEERGVDHDQFETRRDLSLPRAARSAATLSRLGAQSFKGAVPVSHSSTIGSIARSHMSLTNLSAAARSKASGASARSGVEVNGDTAPAEQAVGLLSPAGGDDASDGSNDEGTRAGEAGGTGARGRRGGRTLHHRDRDGGRRRSSSRERGRDGVERDEERHERERGGRRGRGKAEGRARHASSTFEVEGARRESAHADGRGGGAEPLPRLQSLRSGEFTATPHGSVKRGTERAPGAVSSAGGALRSDDARARDDTAAAAAAPAKREWEVDRERRLRGRV
uniref:Ammonium transporter AmtB-like domain-containing protein n=1 Tax=Bicosoecida sp. CB-2014 TaxID=1486930 RepID=A0A7S1GDK7_9STRA|mmetsp:Transcript_90/g.327  ORF Transcript_90/g.327 Transcript_90/m.327 type:complete len:694 (+) Transcript_90:251-2332(+)